MERNSPGRRRTASEAVPWLALATQALAVFLLALPVAAQEKALRWKSLDVEGRLEATGALHLSERHHMVFDGDWNGGERQFRVAAGQRLEFVGISRVDSVTGASVRLTASTEPRIGLDQFAWADGWKLRWRARRSTDPPFRDQSLVYIIEYRLFPVLVHTTGDVYLLSHDFAFADRPGVIEHFSLKFDLDPAWRPPMGFGYQVERPRIPRNESVVLTAPFTWAGEGRPVHVVEQAPTVHQAPVYGQAALPYVPPPAPPPLSPLWKLGLFALFLTAAGATWRRFYRHEAAAGRYVASEVTADWLAENILVHRPEVVGAAWDHWTGHAETAALIAAMAAEGKIQNIAGTSPRLKLLVPRASLSEYERAFVDRLFVRGDEIDRDTLRSHYAMSGFDPAEAIRARLKAQAGALVGELTPGPVAFGGGAVLFALAAWALARRIESEPWLSHLALLGVGLLLVSVVLAASYRWQMRGRAMAALIPVPVLVFAAVATNVAPSPRAMVNFVAIANIVLALALHGARWSGPALQLRNMCNFRAARSFFRRRLKAGADMEERWVPYLLAFGLGTELDRWCVAAPAREKAPSMSAASGTEWKTTANRSGRDPGPTFHPGGGMFGGAGASGSWASSIDSIAQGVAAPPSRSSSDSSSSSSSSSSNSGSSGGSASGGGSGGGW